MYNPDRFTYRIPAAISHMASACLGCLAAAILLWALANSIGVDPPDDSTVPSRAGDDLIQICH